ncbi:CUN085 putative occlusion body protein [Culex nigripalpus nucleopolyhedrovirus]|uniref:CUN085 putative occlusion body protein n=1 Tax=Culex nigripalpus nucleopolyhedrovirus (isolate Florida/1997) TaxID=645993 RepID=Q919J1_NPVCO|nr:CUN085 putative occlusion body protein [Culex nigripalpus nucleopolyhedrovirus]AAK94163.1 CUN085 putative occlusion body protein [Culex nigripalpus nucleopolyhedrovirus]
MLAQELRPHSSGPNICGAHNGYFFFFFILQCSKLITQIYNLDLNKLFDFIFYCVSNCILTMYNTSIRCAGYDRAARTLRLAITPVYCGSTFVVVLPAYMANVGFSSSRLDSWVEISEPVENTKCVIVSYTSLLGHQALNERFLSDNVYDYFESYWKDGSIAEFESFMSNIQQYALREFNDCEERLDLNLTITHHNTIGTMAPGYEYCSIVVVNNRGETLYISSSDLNQRKVRAARSFLNSTNFYVRYRGYGLNYFIVCGSVSKTGQTLNINLTLTRGQIYIVDASSLNYLPDQFNKYVVNLYASDIEYNNLTVAQPTLGQYSVYVLPLMDLKVEQVALDLNIDKQILISTSNKILPIESRDLNKSLQLYTELAKNNFALPNTWRQRYSELVMPLGNIEVSLPTYPLKFTAQLIDRKEGEMALNGTEISVRQSTLIMDGREYSFVNEQIITINEGSHKLNEIYTEYQLVSVSLVTKRANSGEDIQVFEPVSVQESVTPPFSKNLCGKRYKYTFEKDFCVETNSCKNALVMNVRANNSGIDIEDPMPLGVIGLDISPLIRNDCQKGEILEMRSVPREVTAHLSIVNHIKFNVSPNQVLVMIGSEWRELVDQSGEFNLNYLAATSMIGHNHRRTGKLYSAEVFITAAGEGTYDAIKVIARYFDLLYFTNANVLEVREIRKLYTQLKNEYDGCDPAQVKPRYRYAVAITNHMDLSSSHSTSFESNSVDPFFVTVEKEDVPTSYMFQHSANANNVILRVSIDALINSNQSVQTNLNGIWLDTKCDTNALSLLPLVIGRYKDNLPPNTLPELVGVNSILPPLPVVRYILANNRSYVRSNEGCNKPSRRCRDGRCFNMAPVCNQLRSRPYITYQANRIDGRFHNLRSLR